MPASSRNEIAERRFDGELSRLPLPLAGEGWGEGRQAPILMNALSLSLPRKRGRGRCGPTFATSGMLHIRHVRLNNAIRTGVTLMTMVRVLGLAVVALLAAGTAASAQTDAYPSQRVTIVV